MLIIMPGPEIEIKEIVSVAMIGVDIPVGRLSSETGKSGCEPEHGDGIVCKPGDEGVAVLMYSSGKMVCTGAKTAAQAKKAIDAAVDKVRKGGVEVPPYEIRTENIVAKSMVGRLPDLEGLAGTIPGAQYHPGNPPGLVYSVPGSRVSMIVSPGGKVLCTGARTTGEVKSALKSLMKEIESASR
jgi:transcription initiation factor TFIID TATA-box-binding protein